MNRRPKHKKARLTAFDFNEPSLDETLDGLVQGVEAPDVSALLPDGVLDAKTPTVKDGKVAGPDAEAVVPGAGGGGADDELLFESDVAAALELREDESLPSLD